MRTTFIGSLLLSVLCIATFASPRELSLEDMADYSNHFFRAAVEDQMIPGGVIALVHKNRVWTAGFGLSDVDLAITADPEATLYQVGSVGKVFTALAVLSLVDAGQLNLEQDIRDYLPAFPVNDSFAGPITLKDLLTHTAGFDDRVIGYAASTPAGIQPLEDHLIQRMPDRFQPPGRSISYSNYSYALAGLIVEKMGNQPFREFVRQQILDPLEMGNSTYNQSDETRSLVQYATGYAKRSTGFEALPVFYTHPKPAGGLLTTASDMSKFLTFLLQQQPSMPDMPCSPSTLHKMFTRQFSHNPLLPGYTMGWEEQLINGHFAVAKGGQVPGFLSIILVLPDLNTGLFLAVNTSFGSTVSDFLEGFAQRFLPRAPHSEDTSSAPLAVDLSKYTGVYRNNRYNHHSIEDLFALFRDNIRVSISDDGYLRCTQGNHVALYAPINSLEFRNITDGDDWLIFEDGHTGALYRNQSFAGITVPTAYEAVAWYDHPGFVNEFFLSFIPVWLLGYLFFPLLRTIRFLLGLKFKFFRDRPSLPLMANLAGSSFGLLTVLFCFGYIARLNHLGAELVFGIPSSISYLQVAPLVLLFIFLAMSVFAFSIVSRRQGSLLARVYYLSYSAAALMFLMFLYRWHFLGVNI